MDMRVDSRPPTVAWDLEIAWFHNWDVHSLCLFLLPKHSCRSLVSAQPSEQIQPPFKHSLLGIVQSLSSVQRSPRRAVTTRIVAGVGRYTAATPGKVAFPKEICTSLFKVYLSSTQRLSDLPICERQFVRCQTKCPGLSSTLSEILPSVTSDTDVPVVC